MPDGWEYETLRPARDATKKEAIGPKARLNELGAEGWKLLSFSQLTLYTAVSALVVAGVMMDVVDASTITGRMLGIANLTWLVGAAFAATFTPFLLFVAYLFRILTVAKRTLAVGPLILRESQR